MWQLLRRQSVTLLALWLGAVIVAVYASSFFNTFIWDDEQFIYRNIFTTSWRYLPQIFTTNTIAGAGELSNYYRPLTTLSFLIDRQIWGLHPFGFHLTNTFFHAGVGMLFFWLLLRLGLKKVISFWAALLYSLHPLHTEAVTYINSRGDSLFAFWLLFSLISFDTAITNQTWKITIEGHTYEIRQPWLAILTLVGFVISILSKEIAVAGFGLFVILGLWRWGQKKLTQTIFNQKVTVLLITALLASMVGYLGLRLTVLNFNNSLNFYPYENEYTQSLVVRMLTFGRILITYLRLILFPYPLHMERSEPFVTTILSGWVGLVAVIGAGWLALGYWEWRQRRSWLIAIGGLWFLGLLVPVSGIVPINGLLYEHWLYMPLMGAVIAAIGLWQLLSSPQIKAVGRWLVVPILVILASLTVYQNWLWRAPIPFYSYTLQYAQSARLYNNLAMAYDDARNFPRAIELYQQGLAVSNMYPQIYYNLANSYRESGNITEATASAITAIKLDPNFVPAYGLVINAYLDQGNYQAALPYLEYLYQLVPSDMQVALMYGRTLFRLGKLKESEHIFSTVVERSGYNQQVLQTIRDFQQSATPPAQQQ